MANRLSLNVEKTHLFFVSNLEMPYLPQIYYGNNILEFPSEVRYLGVLLDNKLKFKNHIQTICNKISKNTGIIYRLSCDVPHRVLINLYNSLIYPYINYCIVIWGSTYSCHLQPLIVAQKRAVRIINRAPFRSHTNSLFFQNSILKIDDVYVYFVAIYVYNNLSNFTEFSTSQHNTRRRRNLRTEFRRTNVTQASVFFKGPTVWNSIPDYLRSISNIGSFKFHLKRYLISMYNS